MNSVINVRNSMKTRRPSTRRVLRFLGLPHATRIEQVHPTYKNRMVAARRSGDEEMAKILSWAWSHLKRNMPRTCIVCGDASHSKRCKLHLVAQYKVPRVRVRRHYVRSTRLRFADVVRRVVKEVPEKSSPELLAIIRVQFPDVPCSGVRMNGILQHLCKRKEIVGIGKRGRFTYTTSK